MEKKNFEQKKKKKNFDGLLPILWTGHWRAQAWALGRRRGRRGARLGAGALGWACVGRWAGVRGALGWRAWGARQGLAAGVARGRQGARAAGAQGGRCSGGRRTGARGARQGRCWARGAREAQALCARPCTAWAWPGRLGWPWAVHSVHSAHFRSVLTRFFFS